MNESSVKGVLYRGDAKNKYSLPNQPVKPYFRNVYPEELAVVINLPNDDQASQFILRAVDFDLEAVTPMPDVENSKTLTKFTISPERHEAYEKLWNSLTYFGVLANTAVWLYL